MSGLTQDWIIYINAALFIIPFTVRAIIVYYDFDYDPQRSCKSYYKVGAWKGIVELIDILLKFLKLIQ